MDYYDEGGANERDPVCRFSQFGIVRNTGEKWSDLPMTSKGSRRGGSTLQKIAQKKEQMRQYPRIKKLERIATHLRCEVGEIVVGTE